jgi:folate-binding protein YgfZ
MISLPWQVLELNGPDAATFAHAQFCNDVLAVPDGNWQFNAWLNPQGRVRAFFHLLRVDAQRLLLILRGGEARWLCDELARFVFRSRVVMRVADDRFVLASADAEEAATHWQALPKGTATRVGKQTIGIALPGASARWIAVSVTPAASANSNREEGSWRLADVRAGLPEIGVELRDQMLPQWLGLDRLGAVSVRKGCYPGQEIMARLHFKGGNKRSLYRIRWQADVLPTPATPLANADVKAIGAIVQACRDPDSGNIEALASLFDEAAGADLRSEKAVGPIQILERFD